MAQQWYVQLMGSEIGPLSPAAVQEKVRNGQIQAETLVRLGAEGKWQPADRIKGLLSKPAAPVQQSAVKVPEPVAKSAPVLKPPTAVAVPRATIPLAGATPTPIAVAASKSLNDSDHDRTYHIEGGTYEDPADADDGAGSGEYDFFRFVGFEMAIGHALFDRLNRYCHEQNLGMTEVTRRALAEYLGCKELLAAPQTPSAPSPPANSPEP